MPLSDLQVSVARTIMAIPDIDLALAGGGALAVLGIGDRTTRDLDYFATAADEVDSARPVVEQALRDADLTIEVEQSTPGFARYIVGDARDSTMLDLAYDYRLRPPQSSLLGPVLDRDELAADKTLALFGRARPATSSMYSASAATTRAHASATWPHRRDPASIARCSGKPL